MNSPLRRSVDDLPLFVPDIRFPAPVAPGSKSSEEAARKIEVHRPNQYRRILLTLAGAGRALTREGISERTGIKESSLCGRIFELVGAEYINTHELAGVSSSGVRVDTYSLTDAAINRIRAAA